MPENTHPNFYALLVGIDRYSQKPLPDGGYYPNLGGCVRDINHIEKMLQTRLGLTGEQITKLTSPYSNDGEPVEAAQLPTYKNLVEAFKTLTEKANEGDQIYIHYSGHGGRCATMFKELKGENGLDESLVPCDIGENGACYLRDVEMAYLLRAMSEKGLIVTMALDSCHSGGATRGEGGAVVRGIQKIDTTAPPDASAVADKEELLKVFEEMPPDATRSVNAAASGWRLPVPKNFVLIAACRANELANEYAFDGKERNGALTYWMLDSLAQIGDGYTYKMLVNRVAAKVHAKFVDQTPQIEGDGNRQIFGGSRLTMRAAVNVIKVDSAGKRVQLNTGLAQGIGKGAQFAVYAADAKDFADRAQRLAVVELDDAGAAETWARIVEGERAGEIQEGAQAILLGIGIRLRGRIRLTRQKDLPAGINQDGALENLREEIERDEGETTASEKWIRLAADGEEADFQIAVNFHGEYEIWDASGRAVPNLRPAVGVNDKDAAAEIARRLVHLTKYRNARLIDNTDPTSPLARKIVAELGTQTDPNDKQTFRPFGLQTRPLSVGETAYVRVTNFSALPVNIAILDLQPDWGITQILPDAESGQDYQLLEAGADNALLLPMEEIELPNDYLEGTDTLKIFAVVEGASFHWLEMPALDAPALAPKGGVKRSLPADALEQLMTAFDAPNLRNVKIVNLSAPKGRNWATAQVEIRVRRASIAHVADPALSLLQSAFDETIAKNGGETKTRSVNGKEQSVGRPELSDSHISEISQYCVALAQNKISEDELQSFDKTALTDAQERGIVDTAKYCASMAAGVAREWFNAKIWGDDEKYEAYKKALTEKFGDCDLKYQEAMKQYLKFLKESGHIEYRAYNRLSDQVIDNRLPDDATIGIVADWGTGEPEAIEVLRQVKRHNPQIAVHLGDVYYAGTEYEVENYFYQPWNQIFELETSDILSLVLPGNHDYYAGGKPFYDLLDRLAAHNKTQDRPASFFCLRNAHWQLIGLDTALYDRLGGGPTHLEESEAVWLKEKIEHADGRRTILLSHHQLFSANDSWAGKSYNDALYQQIAPILSKVDLWLWGHEHDLVVFDEYKFPDGQTLKRGRCIGGSAFPVGNFEMPATAANTDVHYNRQVALSKGGAFYQHCYVVLKLDGADATVFYYEDRDGGRLLFQETL